ncbi:MAG: flavodoxin family protein [Lachnospiraceae bacterium]|nr:flavodoxin family protein [Lachnospiraceae bacterium]
MKLLILNGSPRPKGNTKQMIEAFCEGLESAGHEYDVFDVCRMNIHGCLACEYCHTKGQGQCVQKDDMQKIYAKLQEAEMLVIASPIYYHGLSGRAGGKTGGTAPVRWGAVRVGRTYSVL